MWNSIIIMVGNTPLLHSLTSNIVKTTVEPVLRGHPSFPRKVALEGRWPFIGGSF